MEHHNNTEYTKWKSISTFPLQPQTCDISSVLSSMCILKYFFQAYINLFTYTFTDFMYSLISYDIFCNLLFSLNNISWVSKLINLNTWHFYWLYIVTKYRCAKIYSNPPLSIDIINCTMHQNSCLQFYFMPLYLFL